MSEAPRGAVHPISARHELPPEAGGKAHGLRLIARAGLAVPEAWAVLPGAGASDLAALAATLSERGLRSLAVRSSAGDEDGGFASFAGVHETALGVPPERLREAIAAVAASATSDRAVAYRRQLGRPPASGGCAVVVQEMVAADASGIAFGRGPDEVAIEAVEGLGEIAVNGEARPEMLVLRRSGDRWAVARRQSRHQRVALRGGEAGTVRTAIDEPRQRADVLAPVVASEIAEGVRALETAAGHSLDVEWAISGGRVAFLQARPQTRPVQAALPPGETWSRANVRDVYPDLPCAIVRFLSASSLDRGQRTALRRQGLGFDRSVPLAATVYGRVVFNDRLFTALSDALGFPESFRAWTRSFAGGSGVSNEIPAVQLSIALRHPILVARNALWAAGAARNARRCLDWLRASRTRRGTEPRPDEAALLARVRTSPVADPDRWIPAMMRISSAIANGYIRAGPLLRGLDAGRLLPRLLPRSEVSVSTRQLEDLVEIARGLRGWAGARPFLSDAPAAAQGWRARLPAELWAAVERWIHAYGHRGPWETDLSWPRYREDLRLLARALEPMVTSPHPPESGEERRLRRAREAEAAWAEVARAVGPLRRVRLRSILRYLAETTCLRERFRSEFMREYAELRDVLRELGRRFAERGRLDAADDVFHLEVPELERAVGDASYDTRAAVRRELARQAAWRRIVVPNRFTTEDIDGMAARALVSRDADEAMRGTAISPGVVEAPACVLRSPDDGERMPTGAVLVAPATDPGWTPLFARASAVVVEIGGLFSHAATVAREYGLPAVANVEAATELLGEGDVVHVDGSRGEVRVVSRAARE